jgi:hypothetical protein
MTTTETAPTTTTSSMPTIRLPARECVCRTHFVTNGTRLGGAAGLPPCGAFLLNNKLPRMRPREIIDRTIPGSRRSPLSIREAVGGHWWGQAGVRLGDVAPPARIQYVWQ